MRINIKRSLLYEELENKTCFSYKNHKFIRNEDNIYFSIKLRNDTSNFENLPHTIKKLIYDLKKLKEKSQEEEKEFMLFDDIYITQKSASFYNICLTKDNNFDIFLSEHIPNDNTPRIHVQIRSNPLWLNNVKEYFNIVLSQCIELLDMYDISIDKVQETRIDFAHHTNYIGNINDYFRDDKLIDTLHYKGSIFKRSYFDRNKDNIIDTNYVAIGERKSNNVFFRVYDKTREVVEKGYKAFFLDLWLFHELISEFDYYCLSYAYKHSNYNKIHDARALFYIEYGRDNNIKTKLKLLLNNKKNYDELIAALHNIVPKVTVITNLEFELKRKFFRTCDKFLSSLPGNDLYDPNTGRIHMILDYDYLFLDYLTDHYVSMRKNDDYTDLWQRFRNSFKPKKSCLKEQLKRNFDNGLDIDRAYTKFKNSLATVCAIENLNTEDNLIEGILILENFNDNHKHDFDKLKEKKRKYFKNKLPKPFK